MMGFQTKNSTYYVDTFNKTITGGYFRDKVVPYIYVQAVIGDNARIKLVDGNVVKTGTVRNIL